MTSNASPPPPGGPAGRRRALGRGPVAPPAEPGEAEPSASLEEADPEALPVEQTGTEAAGPFADGDGAGAAVGLRAETVANGALPAGGGVAPAGFAASVTEASSSSRDAGPVTWRAGSLKATAPGPVDTAGPMAQPAGVAESSGTGAETLPEGAAGAEEASASAPGSPAPAGDTGVPADAGVFKVRLANFEGPFDLLLQLISRHKMDVTEVALSKVTDEFMAHIRAMGPDWDLDETTEFLVVAATLLDLKAARLLPAAEVEDEGDLALLEARDLLFARLLQYRAYKQIADIFSGRLDDEARRYPRTVGLETHHAELLPDVVISIGAEGFAKLAVKAMQPRPKPQVYVDHIHAPLVSVQEQAQIVVARLRELGEASFRALVEDTDDTLTVVARFLALLELYREKAVALEQETALGDLLVRWTGGDGDETPTVTDEFDRPPEPPKEEKKA
ncbi:segregation/condensation protein A [Streptomyces sp. A244]|nr:segregation/condensation protein A [Streptomyces sp. A244]PTH85086.1 segregation/condensation protein A [Streptomyces sp. A244]